jgi:hypothetical protein
VQSLNRKQKFIKTKRLLLEKMENWRWRLSVSLFGLDKAARKARSSCCTVERERGLLDGNSTFLSLAKAHGNCNPVCYIPE